MASGGSRPATEPFVNAAPCLDSRNKSFQLRFDAVICIGVQLVRHTGERTGSQGEQQKRLYGCCSHYSNPAAAAYLYRNTFIGRNLLLWRPFIMYKRKLPVRRF